MSESQTFETLFYELKRPVFSYIVSIVGNVEESEDILQDTFLALYREIQKRSEIESPRAWTYKVAGNLCFSRLRRQRTFRDIVQRVLHQGAQEKWQDNIPEKKMIKGQEMEHLDTLIASLSPKHRAMLTLYRDGFGYQQIADMTDSKVSTVGVTIKRSLDRFEQFGSTMNRRKK